MITSLISTVAIVSALTLNGHLFGSQAELPLAKKQVSLNNRYAVKSVNNVVKDNILLNLAYTNGNARAGQPVDWNKVGQPFDFYFKLNPGETFAYQEDVLPKYQGQVKVTTNAHFNAAEGFKSDGYLTGDGVCHLASLIYWAAKDAKLDAYAPTNHNFAPIPEISREYGVSIYSSPGSKESNAMQNLYVTNNHLNPVKFEFNYQENGELSVTVSEVQ